MTELRHLQLVILQIAKDIDELCKKNDIDYYLLGGSAIGAVRHQGFIPWDDDYDIIMDSNNYCKFIDACRKQLDDKKYYIQEGLVDWPSPFTKIKLRGTRFDEPSGYVNDTGERGIFIDVFMMDNASSLKLAQLWQYICAKYLLCYYLLERGWDKTTILKRVLTLSAAPLKITFIRNFFVRQVERWKDKNTNFLAYFTGPYKYKQCFFKKEYFKSSISLPFEDTELPVPVGYDDWLRHIFGDYMTPPPVNERLGHHLMGVDFGSY